MKKAVLPLHLLWCLFTTRSRFLQTLLVSHCSQPPAPPPFASSQWYSPWDKAQGRWAKRNSGENCEEGVALVGAQSGSPACALPTPSWSSGTSVVQRETEGTETNVSAALRMSGESFMNDNGCLRLYCLIITQL